MIRRHLMALRLALMLGDGVTAVLVFLLVSLVRFGDGEAAEFWRRLGIDIRVAAILFGVAWVGALWSQGLYRLRVRWRLLTEAPGTSPGRRCWSWRSPCRRCSSSTRRT